MTIERARMHRPAKLRVGRPAAVALLYGMVLALPCAAQPDYLLRRLADAEGRPPTALSSPDAGQSFRGPKPGLGPLLQELSVRDPVFGRAYVDFLGYLDELNTQLAAAGGGRFRYQADMPGQEQFARAVEALGGASSMTVRSNELGVTWDTLMATAREFTAAAVREEGLELDEVEHVRLVDLVAIGQIAAVANRALPPTYAAEWRERHPELDDLPTERPADVSARIWQGVCESLVLIHHSGALPWRRSDTSNPHGAYDAYHFFSHAWLVNYGLYRQRYYRGGLGGGEFVERELGACAVSLELRRSDLAGLAYEILTTAGAAGFSDVTRVEDMPPALARLCRRLEIEELPAVEALRDLTVNHAGATFGAALAISGQPLLPSAGDEHKAVLRRFFEEQARQLRTRPTPHAGQPHKLHSLGHG